MRLLSPSRRAVIAVVLACAGLGYVGALQREQSRAAPAEHRLSSRVVYSAVAEVADERVPLPARTASPGERNAISHRSIVAPAPSAVRSMTIESAVSGLVLDASGGAIAGARIDARPVAGGEPPLTSHSGDSGGFSLGLSVGSWLISVAAEGYAGSSQQVYSPSAGVRLLLSPESVIQGRVVGKGDHRPVPGVTVSSKQSQPPYSLISTVSDAKGAFELRGLQAGTHQLEALSRGFRGEPRSVDVGAADTARGVELEVERSSTIDGSIVVDGAACAAGMLELIGPAELSAGADAAGRVELQGVVPGDYEIVVSCPSGLPLRERLLVTDAPLSRVWDLDAGIVVRGSVETAAGEPLAEARVSWTRRVSTSPDAAERQPAAGESWCSSDEHGEFACGGLEPGHYSGSLSVEGKVQSASIELDLRGVRDVPRVRLRADASGIVRVQIEQGSGTYGAATAVFACSAEGEAQLAVRDGESFVLQGLPLGTYGVHLGSSDCGGTAGAKVTLERAGQVAEVSLPLPRGARVRGRLVDPAGVPVADAWVRAADAHPAWALLVDGAPPVLTDGEGVFLLEALLPGSYDLIARGPFEAGTARQHVVLAPGDDHEVKLVLELTAPSTSTSPPLLRQATTTASEEIHDGS